MRKQAMALLATLALGAPAQAGVICAACEYGDTAGSYLGTFDAVAGDVATFVHSDVAGRFADFWVFDVGPAALGSTSADYTLLTSILGFGADLFRDAGSVCSGFDCSSIALGSRVASADASDARFEIVSIFSPGRYVLRIDGSDNPLGTGAYTGQMSFLAFTVREGGTLGLFGLGLLGVAWLIRRRAH